MRSYVYRIPWFAILDMGSGSFKLKKFEIIVFRSDLLALGYCT
jgi:hypothetical protein